jgi:hypothetical protein
LGWQLCARPLCVGNWGKRGQLRWLSALGQPPISLWPHLAVQYARIALWKVRCVGHACTFPARASLFSHRARHLHFLSALSPRLAACWRRCPAARARWRRACCLPCVLARPAAWPLPAACSVHGENWPAAVAVLVLEHAPALMLSCPRRCCWPSCACVSARARCRWCALCVRARARSSGPRSVARTCWHAAWMRVPVPVL